jgi:membrane-associated protease RseP (regulator of RpoE activity)
MNLIPLLPFDGGHIAIAAYEAIRSRPGKPYRADIRKLLPFSYAILAVLLVLFVGNFYLDLVRL